MSDLQPPVQPRVSKHNGKTYIPTTNAAVDTEVTRYELSLRDRSNVEAGKLANVDPEHVRAAILSMRPLTKEQRDRIEFWGSWRGAGITLAIGAVGHAAFGTGGDPSMWHVGCAFLGMVLAYVADRRARIA